MILTLKFTLEYDLFVPKFKFDIDHLINCEHKMQT